MGDLEVPIHELEHVAGRLDLLIEEFHSAGEIVKHHGADIGSGTVKDALHEFADNWETHREELLGKMQAVRDMAAKGREAYLDADDKLARSILKALAEEHR